MAYAQTALDRFGRLDFLINNVGISPVVGSLLDLDLAVARTMIEVNDLAALGWTQKAVKGGILRARGAVVNVSSFAATAATPDLGMYAASKAMLTHLTRQFALELAPHVRVNAVAPAVVMTDLVRHRVDPAERRSLYPLGRLGQPDDVADAVEFLSRTGSDGGSHSTEG